MIGTIEVVGTAIRCRDDSGTLPPDCGYVALASRQRTCCDYPGSALQHESRVAFDMQESPEFISRSPLKVLKNAPLCAVIVVVACLPEHFG